LADPTRKWQANAFEQEVAEAAEGICFFKPPRSLRPPVPELREPSGEEDRLMDWWRRLPALVRIPIAIGTISFATFLFASGLRVAIGLFALGVVLLFSGPSDAQKKGYHDF
jgi:hypothetical protein